MPERIVQVEIVLTVRGEDGLLRTRSIGSRWPLRQVKLEQGTLALRPARGGRKPVGKVVSVIAKWAASD